MGKIPRSGFALENLKIKVKKPSLGQMSCGPEAAAYLSCLEAHGGDESACKMARDALAQCMKTSASARGSNHKPTINYHLQKFVIAFKRRVERLLAIAIAQKG
ncbi:MAG: hypothetical protein SGPRY_013445 [Prymnesium sp.]